MNLQGFIAATSWKRAGNSHRRAAREMVMWPVSSGSRSASSAARGNSGSLLSDLISPNSCQRTGGMKVLICLSGPLSVILYARNYPRLRDVDNLAFAGKEHLVWDCWTLSAEKQQEVKRRLPVWISSKP
jgi:hypothetical protein